MSIESNILCKLHHKLPLMSAMDRMSNQNVSGCDDKSHKTKKKMSYMNRKHFCLQETQKTQCYILCWNSKHTKEKTHNCVKSKNSRHNLKLEQEVLEKGKGKMDAKIKAS